MPIDFTNYKNGEMPEAIKWLYRMFLLYNGYVVSYKVDFTDTGGFREEYKIIGTMPESVSVSMSLMIDCQTGNMDACIEKSGDPIPIYTLGSMPVEYLNSIKWKTFGNEEQDGQEYKKIT